MITCAIIVGEGVQGDSLMRLHLLIDSLMVFNKSDLPSTVIDESLVPVGVLRRALWQRFEEDRYPVFVSNLLIFRVKDHIKSLDLEVNRDWFASVIKVPFCVEFAVLPLNMESNSPHDEVIFDIAVNVRGFDVVVDH